MDCLFDKFFHQLSLPGGESLDVKWVDMCSTHHHDILTDHIRAKIQERMTIL